MCRSPQSVRHPILLPDYRRRSAPWSFSATPIAISDPDTDAHGLSTCAIGERTWFVGDLAAAHDFVLAGLGWAHMPLEIVAADLAAGRLVKLPVALAEAGDVLLAFQMSSLRGRRYSQSEEEFLAKLRGVGVRQADAA